MQYESFQNQLWTAPSFSAVYTYRVELQPDNMLISEGDGHVTESGAIVSYKEFFESTHWQQVVEEYFGPKGRAEIIEAAKQHLQQENN